MSARTYPAFAYWPDGTIEDIRLTDWAPDEIHHRSAAQRARRFLELLNADRPAPATAPADPAGEGTRFRRSGFEGGVPVYRPAL